MSSDKRAANAVGGRTTRPCDSCLCNRARWYCAADDAFLCESCDASVHSANPLARRHERLSLKTTTGPSLSADPFPSWLNGFRRKARTPRHSKTTTTTSTAKAEAEAEPLQIQLLVPDLSCGDEPSPLYEDQLLYRVPIFDPITDAIIPAVDSIPASDESKPFTLHEADVVAEADYMMEFATCDADLAADVESLLGKGFEEESFSMEALGLIEGEMEWRIKVEEVDVAGLDARHVDASELDLSCESLDLKFGYESPTTTTTMMYEEEKENKKKKKKICLRLDYEAIITEWASKGSPWTTGDHPQLNLDDCWPDCTGMWGWEHQHQQQQHEYGVGVGVRGGQGEGDRGREARVSRYREKRRSRLFSKKIRYEVRKLNAEKRPRMKGRFVKRASLAGGGPAAVAFPF